LHPRAGEGTFFVISLVIVVGVKFYQPANQPTIGR
jgi:hypothetical protein